MQAQASTGEQSRDFEYYLTVWSRLSSFISSPPAGGCVDAFASVPAAMRIVTVVVENDPCFAGARASATRADRVVAVDGSSSSRA